MQRLTSFQILRHDLELLWQWMPEWMNPVQKPSCGSRAGGTKSIGYYESWSLTHDCDVMGPDDIVAGLWTHLKQVETISLFDRLSNHRKIMHLL